MVHGANFLKAMLRICKLDHVPLDVTPRSLVAARQREFVVKWPMQKNSSRSYKIHLKI